MMSADIAMEDPRVDEVMGERSKQDTSAQVTAQVQPGEEVPTGLDESADLSNTTTRPQQQAVEGLARENIASTTGRDSATVAQKGKEKGKLGIVGP